MVLSDDETMNTVGQVRLGVAAVLSPLFVIAGGALLLLGEHLLGAGSIGIGLILAVGAVRLYRAIQRPDVVRDERAKQLHDRAGANAFWTTVLLPTTYIGVSVVLPESVTGQVVSVVTGETGTVWALAVGSGFVVYLGSTAYYRATGV
jgi:hypothetical protein